MPSNYIYDLRAPRTACVLHGKNPSETTVLDTRKLEKREFSANRRRKIVSKILVIKRNVS